VALAALAVCAGSLWSRLGPDHATTSLAQVGFDPRRLAHPFDYWNAVGCWSAMTVALLLALSAHARSALARGATLAGVCVAVTTAYLTYSRTTAAAVALAAVAAVACSRHRWRAALHAVVAGAGSLAVILAVRGAPAVADGTGTAGSGTIVAVLAAAMAACVGAAVATRADRLDRLRVPPRVTRGALALGLAGLAAVAVVLGPDAWDSFRSTTVVTSDDPAARLTSLAGERRLLWDDALGAFADHPLGGTGAGTFEFTWNRDPRRSEKAIDAHSLYLEALAETGLVGALLVVLALGALLTGAVRALARAPDGPAAGAAGAATAAFAVFCLFAGVDWMWESTAVVVLALVLAVLAQAGGAREAGRLELPRRFAVPAVAAIAVVVQLPSLGAAVALKSSQAAARRGDLREAYASASQAVAVQPWSAVGWLQRAQVLERGNQLEPAIEDARTATRREPDNWATWLVVARIEAKRGRTAQAVAATRRARRLNPASPAFRTAP
jgi:tetratricopeptide (TPR) repeat protein